MALILAPYNDSMRLGMGFNSYSQTTCIDNAVEVKANSSTVHSNGTAQVVTYSSRLVSTLSDVVDSMNISYSNSIKKGTVEIAGNKNSVNEDKIKESDINAVVSVKVVNQTTILSDNCVFKAIKDVNPGTNAFNEYFGDCYISGFIEGGEFTGIVSMRVLDRTKVSQATSQVKQTLSAGRAAQFSLDAVNDGSNGIGSTLANKMETTVTVSWMGGGQVKEPKAAWDADSMFAAAAAFPNQVSNCPQRTWAILTKYKANRSFAEWSSGMKFDSLEYDSVNSYTAELFEDFMEYKQLLKLVQNIIDNRGAYSIQPLKHNAISTETNTLLAVRLAFRQEMNKIVQAVDVLTKDPSLLKAILTSAGESADPTVANIVKEARASQTKLSVVDSAGNGAPTVESPGSDTVLVPSPNASAKNGAFDFGSLIAPEVWAELMPVSTKSSAAAPLPTQSLSTLLAGFPPAQAPPVVKLEPGVVAPVVVIKKVEPVPPNLKIHIATTGGSDVSDSIRKNINAKQNLVVDMASYTSSLFVIYEFEGSSPRIAIATGKGTLTLTSTSDYPLLTIPNWTVDTWSVWALTDNDKLSMTPQNINNVKATISKGYTTGQRILSVFQGYNFDMMRTMGQAIPLVQIFYQSTSNGPVKVASSAQGSAPNIAV